MRRALLLLLAAFAIAAIPATTATAGAQAHFSGCQRDFNGTRNDPAVAVFYIEVRVISCQTAYNYIKNFPLGLKSGKIYRSYTCIDKFSPSSDTFRFVCTDGRKAYKFAAAGE